MLNLMVQNSVLNLMRRELYNSECLSRELQGLTVRLDLFADP